MLEVFTDQYDASIVWTAQDGTTLCEGCMELYVSPTKTSTYYLSIENEFGCTTSTEITIKVDDACSNAQLEIPNIISPNGDGANDYFEIRYEGVTEISSLRIYNRWGELVYHTQNILDYWDGTFRGTPLNPGVYVYYVEGICLNGDNFTKTGNVTILK